MDITELNNLRKLRKYLKMEPSSVIKEVIEKLTTVHDEVFEREQQEEAERLIQEELLEEQRKAILESGVDIAALMQALSQDVNHKKTSKPKTPRLKQSENQPEKPQGDTQQPAQ